MPLAIDPIYILLIAVVVFLASYLAITYLREASSQKKEERGRVITVSKCLSCGHTVSTDYGKDDYVGRKSGKCPKCGGDMGVVAIYMEMPAQPHEK
ncbi:MAG: hypothetical protein QXS42_00330 [Zestosphaera sp.]